MKRILHIAAGMAMAILLAPSCSKEPVGSGDLTKDSQIEHLVAKARGNTPVVRSALVGGDGQDRNNVKFLPGDKIGVFSTAVNGPATSFDMVGEPAQDGSATFAGDIETASDSYFAISPYWYKASLTRKDDGYTVMFGVHSHQYPVEGNYDPTAVFAIGFAQDEDHDGNVSFTLENVNCLLKFRVPEGEDIYKAVLRGNNSEVIAGDVDINLDADGNILSFSRISDVPFPDSNIAVEIWDGNKLKPGVDYYFSIPPCVFKNGFSISLFKSKDDFYPIYGRTTDKEVTASNGKILNLGTIPGDRIDKWQGTGTENDPYLITCYEDLAKLSGAFAEYGYDPDLAGKYFKQTRNIDCRGNVIGIGTYNSSTELPFIGTYDGQNHTISNYRLPSIEQHFGKEKNFWNVHYSGLFIYAKNSIFKNLTICPAPFKKDNKSTAVGSYSGMYYVGGLVGLSWGENGNGNIFENCHLKGELTLDRTDVSAYFGGLVGCSRGNLRLSDCSNEAKMDITSKYDDYDGLLGGLVGYVHDDGRTGAYHQPRIWVHRCRNKGNLTIHGHRETNIGGIIGLISGCVLEMHSCVNEGNISADGNPDGNWDANAGGMIGAYKEAFDKNEIVFIHNCLNKGNIRAKGDDASCGGMLGYSWDYILKIGICVNTGSITGESDPHNGAMAGMGNDLLDGWSGDAHCIGCYWLDSKSCGDGIEAAIPYRYNVSKEASEDFDCYFYKTLSASTMNNRILNGWNAYVEGSSHGDKETRWDRTTWLANAALWVGESKWGGDNGLDLDFTRTVGSIKTTD